MKKKIIWGVVIVIVLVVAVQTFRDWRDSTYADRLVKELRKQEQDILDKKIADKIGGKTPQETLGLFIEAVEKDDYELASRYLIIEDQVKEKEKLVALKQNNNLSWFLDVLKRAKEDGPLEDNYFRMKAKTELGVDYFIRFIQYPSGNWKIEKI